VVDDATRQGATRFVNLGDSLSGPLYPRETADYLMAVDWLQIRGNHERQMLGQGIRQRGALDQFTFDALTPRHLQWMEHLPSDAWLDQDVYLCHGTPDSDLEYLLEGFTQGRFGARPLEEVSARLRNIPARVVLCGHSHVPRVVTVPEGKLVVNPGSVGLQAYEDVQPWPHAVANGDPRARYALLHHSAEGWYAVIRCVDYEHERVHHHALSRNRPDWAQGLLTGTLA